MANDFENATVTENDIFELAKKARGVHAAALFLASESNDEAMAEGVAALVGGLCDDLARLHERMANELKSNAGAA